MHFYDGRWHVKSKDDIILKQKQYNYPGNSNCSHHSQIKSDLKESEGKGQDRYIAGIRNLILWQSF